MQDMLVRLYDLPDVTEEEKKLNASGIKIKRPIAPEKHVVVQWVRENFSELWASEVDVAFSRSPVSCLIAYEGATITGFACYDTTSKNFFGPTGVSEKYRGRSIGKILLIKVLDSMKNDGYAYAIIGGVGPHEYYEKTVGAVLIKDSERSVYQDLIKST